MVVTCGESERQGYIVAESGWVWRFRVSSLVLPDVGLYKAFLRFTHATLPR